MTRNALLMVTLLVAGCTAIRPGPVERPAALGSPVRLAVGEVAAYPDGLRVQLMQVNDSRCRPGVQCIWAGELSPVLQLRGGQLGATVLQTFLGTTRVRRQIVGAYEVLLHEAGTDFALITVVIGDRDAAADELIRVRAPLPREYVTSPLRVEGEARGLWFFEATFPVTLLDASGNVLAQTYAQASGDWQTPGFVSFTSVVEFATPGTTTGMLLLQKTNPSGDPQRDASRSIPVRFAP